MGEISTNREENRDNDREKQKIPLLRRAMDAFGTIFALNVCFVVGCIPIFTVGASLSALYAMCIRLQEDEEETVVAGFVHEFKRSFKQSTIAYFCILLAIFVMYFEFLLVKKVTGFISTFYTGVLITELIFMALIVPFLFPLIAWNYSKKFIGAFHHIFWFMDQSVYSMVCTDIYMYKIPDHICEYMVSVGTVTFWSNRIWNKYHYEKDIQTE